MMVSLIIIEVLVISQIEVHSESCTKGVVIARSEVAVAIFVLEKLVSLAIRSAAPTLAIKAKTENLIIIEAVHWIWCRWESGRCV
jgi:hypothetical protein